MDLGIYFAGGALLGMIGVRLAQGFFFRFRQAGRAGYGFEARGAARWNVAWRLWAKYDLGVADYDIPFKHVSGRK